MIESDIRESSAAYWLLAIMLMVFDESLTFRLAVGNHRNYCSIPHENACILSPIT